MGHLGTFIIVALLGLSGVYYYHQYVNEPLGEVIVPGDPVVHIGDTTLRVMVANTKASRAQGLSGRRSLDPYGGLLFIFDDSSYHGIWMKDMNFSIDVIWINSDLKVVGITTNLTPGSYPRIFEPPSPVKYIIETKPHFADNIGIQVGDKVRLPLGY